MIKNLRKQIEEAKQELRNELIQQLSKMLGEEPEVFNVQLDEFLNNIIVYINKSEQKEDAVKLVNYEFGLQTIAPQQEGAEPTIDYLFAGRSMTLHLDNGSVVGTSSEYIKINFKLLQLIFQIMQTFKDAHTETDEVKEEAETVETPPVE